MIAARRGRVNGVHSGFPIEPIGQLRVNEAHHIPAGGKTVNEIEQAAQLSVGRACGFAGFGIALTVLGLSFDPVIAAKIGAVLSLGLTLTLLINASRAHHTPHETTEVWLLIDQKSSPPAQHARRIINEARRFAMLWFARWSAASSALFASIAILLALVRAP
jgi:hypothetical protein